MKKILVTGATGLIGQALCIELLKKGHGLRILSRNAERAKKALGLPCEAWNWNPLTEKPPAAAIKGSHAVIHLLGESVAGGRWSDSRKKAIYDSRALGTQNLVSALQDDFSGEVFISASGAGYYGDAGEQELNESSPSGKDFLSSVCRAWEEPALQFKKTRAIILRTGVVLSHPGGALEKMLPAFRARLGGRLGNGNQWMSWIHVQDLVSLILFGLENPGLSGPVNAVSPEPVRNATFTRQLAQELQVCVGPSVPAFALKLGVGEMAQVLLSSQRAVPEKAMKAGFKFKFPNLHMALNSLSIKDDCFFATQWVPKNRSEIFPFFSDARNLEQITPPFLGFKITHMSSDHIEKGTLIDYSLKIHGIPLHWRTLIAEWNPPHSFVDDQLKGPYAKWFHTHEFFETDQGTLLTDRVLYKIPMGMLGRVAAGWKIKSDIEMIFNYRRKVITERFGPLP